MLRWHRQQPAETYWWEVPLAVTLFLLVVAAAFSNL
jgi:hypothetical protein